MVSVRRSGMYSVAAQVGDAPIALPALRGREAIEAEMVDVVRLSWRLHDITPSASPFAKDGPWHLMVRALNAGDYDARGGDLAEAPTPRMPLTREDMARIDRASGWFAMLQSRPMRAGLTAHASDGAIVAAALRQKASGRSQVDWGRVLHAVGLMRGQGALRHRFDRAMNWLAERVQSSVGASH